MSVFKRRMSNVDFKPTLKSLLSLHSPSVDGVLTLPKVADGDKDVEVLTSAKRQDRASFFGVFNTFSVFYRRSSVKREHQRPTLAWPWVLLGFAMRCSTDRSSSLRFEARAVKAIKLEFPKLTKLDIDSNAFRKVKNSVVLKVKNVKSSKISTLDFLPNSLRWMSWYEFCSFSSDTCKTLEIFQENPNNNSLSSILPCEKLLTAKSVLTDVNTQIAISYPDIALGSNTIRIGDIPEGAITKQMTAIEEMVASEYN
uniref:Uncharacterized protein n=1 Tax=Cucumis melo TaxID=3656 RepID=A0A9I9E6N0_CUCME